MKMLFSDQSLGGLLITAGDSLQTQPAVAPWPTQAAQNLIGWKIVNQAVPGRPSADVLSNIDDILDLYDAARARNVVALQCGTNDGLFGVSIATTLANIRAIADAVMAKGFQFIVGTLPPSAFVEQQQAGWDAVRLSLNQQIRGNFDYRQVADLACPQGRYAVLADAANTALFQADGTHFTTLGATGCKDRFVPLILAAPNTVPSVTQEADAYRVSLPLRDGVAMCFQPV